jgi:hypothetical protein
MADRVKAHAASIDAKVAFEKVNSTNYEAGLGNKDCRGLVQSRVCKLASWQTQHIFHVIELNLSLVLPLCSLIAVTSFEAACNFRKIRYSSSIHTKPFG